MANSGPPSTRKARRAAAKTSTPSPDAAIPLAQPDRSGSKPNIKTLYDIAAERQAALAKLASSHQASESTDGARSSKEEEPIGPLGHSLFLSTSLSMLHFTLDVLVFHQYRQTIEWREITVRTLTTLPVLFLLIYTLSAGPLSRSGSLRQVLFLGVAVAAGCYMVHCGSQGGYYAVMKRAPPVGTLWVWSVVELKLVWAVCSVAIVGLFFWWGGYTIF